MKVYKKYRKGRKRGGQRYHTKRKRKVKKKSWKRDEILPFIKTKIKLVNPEDISFIESPQGKDKEKIKQIKESGEIKKPIWVYAKHFPDQKYQVWEGHHRVLAARQRKDKTIPAIVSLNVEDLKISRGSKTPKQIIKEKGKLNLELSRLPDDFLIGTKRWL